MNKQKIPFLNRIQQPFLLGRSKLALGNLFIGIVLIGLVIFFPERYDNAIFGAVMGINLFLWYMDKRFQNRQRLALYSLILEIKHYSEFKKNPQIEAHLKECRYYLDKICQTLGKKESQRVYDEFNRQETCLRHNRKYREKVKLGLDEKIWKIVMFAGIGIYVLWMLFSFIKVYLAVRSPYMLIGIIAGILIFIGGILNMRDIEYDCDFC
jgi:hypothetical protein